MKHRTANIVLGMVAGSATAIVTIAIWSATINPPEPDGVITGFIAGITLTLAGAALGALLS